MKLFTKAIEAKLAKSDGGQGNEAICKIFNPYGGQTWIIFGADTDCPDRLWVVADLGFGFVEFGSQWRHELEEWRHPQMKMLGFERDSSFEPGKQLEHYLEKTTLAGCS